MLWDFSQRASAKYGFCPKESKCTKKSLVQVKCNNVPENFWWNFVLFTVKTFIASKSEFWNLALIQRHCVTDWHWFIPLQEGADWAGAGWGEGRPERAVRGQVQGQGTLSVPGTGMRSHQHQEHHNGWMIHGKLDPARISLKILDTDPRNVWTIYQNCWTNDNLRSKYLCNIIREQRSTFFWKSVRNAGWHISLIQTSRLTSRQKFRMGLACTDLARPKRNLCFDANTRFESTRCVTLYFQFCFLLGTTLTTYWLFKSFVVYLSSHSNLG